MLSIHRISAISAKSNDGGWVTLKLTSTSPIDPEIKITLYFEDWTAANVWGKEIAQALTKAINDLPKSPAGKEAA